MDGTKKLIELLGEYIEENKKVKEIYNIKRTQITLFEELLNYLKSKDKEEIKIMAPLLLNTIYGNNIYVDELYSILLSQTSNDELEKFINKIEKEYTLLRTEVFQLKKRIDRTYELINSAYRARKSFSLNTKISDAKSDVINVKKIIHYYGTAGIISNREELYLINEVEMHNRKVASRYALKEEKEYTDYLYNELPNILMFGFQPHDEIEVSKERRNTLDTFIKEIKQILEKIEKEQIIQFIEGYKKYNLEEQEYNYILTRILDDYLDELLSLYTLLLDREIYERRDQRIEVIKDYYSSLEKYLIILNYYNKINECIVEEMDEEEIKETEKQEERKLIYAHSASNITQAKILSDMTTIP